MQFTVFESACLNRKLQNVMIEAADDSKDKETDPWGCLCGMLKGLQAQILKTVLSSALILIKEKISAITCIHIIMKLKMTIKSIFDYPFFGLSEQKSRPEVTAIIASKQESSLSHATLKDSKTQNANH